MKHPGFETVVSQVAKRTNPATGQPYGTERARRIVGYMKAHASTAAKRTNPHLERNG